MRSVAARANDGSFALAYLPKGSRGITIDLGALSGPWVTARWFDPSNGRFVAVDGSPFKAGVTYHFLLGSSNQAGLDDWVLELTSQADQNPPQ